MTFDLSSCWSKATAEALADTMRASMDGTDKAPIREHYRRATDSNLRGLIAHLMRAK